ncbi:MAG TPA: purine-nucleoside phosphorylase [Chloroflexota bacterium]
MAANAAAAVRRRCPVQPEIGLILGSGLGGLADRIEGAVAVDYIDIPNFPRSNVEGHANQLVLGRLAGRDVAAMRGRVHLYEGWSAAEVAFPVRVLHALGATALLVSNAAGGLNLDFQAGDLMLIRDHIFLPGLAGHNPLTGPNDDSLGPRFPSMAGAYDEALRALAKGIAGQQDQPLREGVYAMAAGPSYETPAEYQALRAMGADAVGMSTCPEVVVARHMGLRVLGISLITNVLTGKPVSHEEVLATASAAAERFSALVEAILAELPLPLGDGRGEGS